MWLEGKEFLNFTRGSAIINYYFELERLCVRRFYSGLIILTTNLLK